MTGLKKKLLKLFKISKKVKTVTEDKEDGKIITNRKEDNEGISDLKKGHGQSHGRNSVTRDQVKNELDDSKNTKISESDPAESDSLKHNPNKDIENHSNNKNSQQNNIFSHNNNLYKEIEDEKPKLSNLAQEVLEVFHQKPDEVVENDHNLIVSRTLAEDTTRNFEIKSCKPTAIVKPCKISDEVSDDSKGYGSEVDKLDEDKNFEFNEDVTKTEISKQSTETEYLSSCDVNKKEQQVEAKDQQSIITNCDDRISPSEDVPEADTNITRPLPELSHKELEEKLKTIDKELKVTKEELDHTEDNNDQMMVGL
jgi:hypothetical protein